MSRKRSKKPEQENKQNKRRAPEEPIRKGSLQPIIPKTKGQEEFIDAIASHDITICDGPAGSGKSLIAFGSALHFRESDHRIKKIVIVRPVLPSGDDDELGALPGGLEEKMGPFIAPFVKDIAPLLIEADSSLTGNEYTAFVENYLKSINIEIVPLSFMRGRTFNNSFVILDEAQNCTKKDFKLFLTRIGKNSKVVIEGDSTQSDRLDGYIPQVQALFLEMDEIAIVKLQNSDIVRNPLISRMLARFPDEGNN